MRGSDGFAAALLAVLAGTAAVLSQATPSGRLSREVRSDDWGIADWSAVRQGQLSVTRLPGGDELNVLALSTSARAAAPDRFRGEAPACDGNCFRVATFDFGTVNALGGRFNAFAAAPSSARAALRAGPDNRRALTLDYARAAQGACGAWLHLFDAARPAAERVYLDARPFAVLSFWIRGREGGERLLLKAADAAWERREDALPLGEVASFLPSGRVDTVWQRAVVPLSALPSGLKRDLLALIAFEALGPGDGQVAISDLHFCLQSAPLPPLSPAAGITHGARATARALWVWNTAEILPDEAAQAALLSFCSRHGFTDLFLQLPNAPARLGAAGDVTLEQATWTAFLDRLGRAGLRAYALDGARHFALPENHARVLKTVDNVVRYNAAAPRGARFAGVHFDIEPYLLPGFQGPRRSRILSDWLTLLSGIAARARSGGLTVGADIPFWYDSPSGADGRVPVVEFNGTRKPASEHALDLVDQVGLMDYRTVAHGADGFIGLAEDELRYAGSRGRRVFVGLETTALPDEELIEFEGPPRAGALDRAPGTRTVVLEPRPPGAVFQLLPPGAAGETDGADTPRRLWWPVSRAITVPATKLTFAHLGPAALHDAMREATEELSRYPAFAGFAIHDYTGYRALLSAGDR